MSLFEDIGPFSQVHRPAPEYVEIGSNSVSIVCPSFARRGR